MISECIYCGKRLETPDHTYGPEIRNHYLFVLANKGTAILHHEKQIKFGEHDLLVMFPNERIYYKAIEPWSISWVGLYGETVEEYTELLGVTPQNLILHISLYNELSSVMGKIYDTSKTKSYSSQLHNIGLIYEFFSILMENSALKKNRYNKFRIENYRLQLLLRYFG